MIRIENIQGGPYAIDLRKVVIKIGSAVLIGRGDRVDEAVMVSVADSIAALRKRGVQVIVVSSGAVGMGRRVFPDAPADSIPDRQALAAIGQVGLMHTYKNHFNARGFRAAQVLLTREDMDDRRRYLNARYTLERLLELGAVPVVNENDTVTVDELQFGDNDELSALIAAKMQADLLIILSIVAGVYAEDPDRAEKAGRRPEVIPVIERIDENARRLAGPGASALGRGGMVTKLSAARIAAMAGVHTVIAGGKTPEIVNQVLSGRFGGTYFPPEPKKLRGRTRWIAFGRQARGRRVVVDDGAREALVRRNKSLLAAGVREVHGSFEPGDVVEVVGADGECIARGLINYSDAQLRLIMGKRTKDIRAVLGEIQYDEVIHRDNLAIIH